MIEHLLERLDDTDDATLKTETEKKRRDGIQRMEDAKVSLTELLTKYNKEKADKKKIS